MDIDFTYDPNKTIIEKMVEYHKKLIDDEFDGAIIVNFRKGHVARISETKDILRYYPDDEDPLRGFKSRAKIMSEQQGEDNIRY